MLIVAILVFIVGIGLQFIAPLNRFIFSNAFTGIIYALLFGWPIYYFLTALTTSRVKSPDPRIIIDENAKPGSIDWIKANLNPRDAKIIQDLQDEAKGKKPS